MVIRKIINRNAIRILFQPIHDIKTERIIGYEALARGPEGEGANRLFTLAKEAGLKDELEIANVPHSSYFSGELGTFFH